MQKASGAKTASVRKTAIVLALFLGTLGLVIAANRSAPSTRATQYGDSPRIIEVCRGQTSCEQQLWQTEELSSRDSQTKGLGGRAELAAKTGVLFSFAKTGPQCIWMKDMRFAIDIIWVNEQKKVVLIRNAVQPSTYPEQFCSDGTAKYVIEVNAGAVSDADINTGDYLWF